MAETLLYIKFQDTASDKSASSLKIALDNLQAQLLTAAEKIKQNPEAICDYIRQDSPVTLKNEVEVKPEAETTPNITQPPVITNEEDMVRVVFETIKRTQKSEAIVRYLVQNSGIDLSVEQIAAGASLTKPDLSVWFSQTGKKIPAIVNTSRGFYKFNPNLLVK